MPDARFEMILPPQAETFSHRTETISRRTGDIFPARPCRYEYTSSAGGVRGTCPHYEYCLNSAPGLARLEGVRDKEGDLVVEAYGPWIRVTQSEPSTVLVVRSEHHFSRDERDRFSIRKHIYELAPSGGKDPKKNEEHTRLPAAFCHDLMADDRYRMYLGFVDTRPHSRRAAIALGCLAPPKRYRQDPNTFVMTGLYGRLFGGEGFPCTIYSMHEPEITGAVCAQACAIIALGMLTDRGARLNGSFTLTYLGTRGRKASRKLGEDESCVGKRHESSIANWFNVEGLSPQELEQYFNTFGKVSAFHHRLREDTARPSVTDRFIARLIEAYVIARFPVILAVDTDTWETKDSAKRRRSSKHAAVIIGIRHSNLNPEDVAFIVHDPGWLPFLERSAKTCITACKFYGSCEKECLKGTHHPVELIAVADQGIRRDLWRCLRAVACDDSYRRLLQPYEEGKGDLRIRLLWRDDLADGLLPIGERGEPRNVLNELLRTELQPSRYWTIACYERDDVLQHAWLFDANEADDFFAAKISGHFVTWTREGTTCERLELASPPEDTDEAFKVVERALRSERTRREDTETQLHRKRELSNRRGGERLHESVITSCSIRRLRDFFDDVRRVDRVDTFDLMMLRDADIEDILSSTSLFVGPSGDEVELATQDESDRSIARVLACGKNVEPISDWLARTIQGARIKIAAFATYLPQIASAIETPSILASQAASRPPYPQWLAKKALANIVKIGRFLREAGCLTDKRFVVEIVCGTLLDTCPCSDCRETVREDRTRRPQRVFEMSRSARISRLLSALNWVVDEVTGEADPRDFVFALELEPGPAYLLNSLAALAEMKAAIQKSAIKDYVGFNLDIAHMKIAGIHAHDLYDLRHDFVHAHIADHPPFMHTRDQVPGDWTPIQYGNFERYLPYLRLLDMAAVVRDGSALPLTRAIALELEGCNRIAWTHKGLNALKQLLRAV